MLCKVQIRLSGCRMAPLISRMEVITIESTNSDRFGIEGGQSVAKPIIKSISDSTFDRARILHVDDDPDFAELTAVFLERENDRFEVLTETCPTAALETLEEHSVDCIISDYQMPEMDGLELLEAVRADYPELPFILCTARGSEEVASDAIASGVTDYIQKGTDTDQYEVLAHRVQNAIEQYRTSQQLWSTVKWYEHILEQSLIGVFIVQDEAIVYANERLGEQFDTTSDDLIDSSPDRLIKGTRSPALSDLCQVAASSRSDTVEATIEGVTDDGHDLEFETEIGQIKFAGSPAALGLLRVKEEYY